MEYLTDQDYEIAKSNGISRRNAYRRFYIDGWSKHRAITTPIKKWIRLWKKWGETAESNGIKFYTFRKRINLGWPPEEASYYPIGTNFKKLKEKSDECPAL